jgi:hypothetical protein
MKFVDEAYIDIAAGDGGNGCVSFRHEKYKEFGAYDTEPDGVFQWLVDQAVKGLKPDIPRTGARWDLYDSSMDCTEAARALHDQALNVITAIEECPVRDLDLLRSKLQEYCWRLY